MQDAGITFMCQMLTSVNIKKWVYYIEIKLFSNHPRTIKSLKFCLFYCGETGVSINESSLYEIVLFPMKSYILTGIFVNHWRSLLNAAWIFYLRIVKWIYNSFVSFSVVRRNKTSMDLHLNIFFLTDHPQSKFCTHPCASFVCNGNLRTEIHIYRLTSER